MERFRKLELSTQANSKESDVVVSSAARDQSYWMDAANRERRMGHFETALRYYSRTLELDRAVVPAWVGQVQMLVQLGEYPEADLWARKSLEIFPGNSELLAGRAQAVCRLGGTQQARELSDAALVKEGVSAYRWIVRGELMLCRRQQTDDYCFEKALQSDADWAVPVEIALVCRHYGASAKALKYVRYALEKAPEEPYPWWVAGTCQSDLEMVGPAIQSFKRCLDVSPGHVDAQRSLAALSHRPFSPVRWLRGLWRRR